MLCQLGVAGPLIDDVPPTLRRQFDTMAVWIEGLIENGHWPCWLADDSLR